MHAKIAAATAHLLRGLLLLASRLLLLLLLKDLLRRHLLRHLRNVADVCQPRYTIQELAQVLLLLWVLLLLVRMRGHAAAKLLLLTLESCLLGRLPAALVAAAANALLLLSLALATLLLLRLLLLHQELLALALLGDRKSALINLLGGLLARQLFIHEVVVAGQVLNLILLIIVFKVVELVLIVARIFYLYLTCLIDKPLEFVARPIHDASEPVLTSHLRADALHISTIAAHALCGIFRLEAIALTRLRHCVLLPLTQVHLLEAVTATLPLLLTLARDRVELIVFRVFFIVVVISILLLQIVLLVIFSFFIIVAFVVKLVGDVDRATLQLNLLSVLLREEVRSAT